jgi:hypothetical protein
MKLDLQLSLSSLDAELQIEDSGNETTISIPLLFLSGLTAKRDAEATEVVWNQY